MDVILLERIEKLGNVGDSVKVKSGYARNYLIPQNKALRATKENIAYFEARKSEIEKDLAEKKKGADKIAKKLEGQFLTLIRQAGEDDRLYGSVTARDVAKAANDQDIELSHKEVKLLKPVKYLGVYEVKAVLHSDVIVSVHINVARSADEAEEAKKEFLNPSKAKKTAKDAPAQAKTEKQPDASKEENVEAAPAAEADASSEGVNDENAPEANSAEKLDAETEAKAS